MSVKIENFRIAMRAALDGPERRDIEWTSSGHDFNVKRVRVVERDGEIEIDGGNGNHISHRLKWRPDDQIRFACKVGSDGRVRDLEINVTSSLDVLKEWFDVISTIRDLFADDDGKADTMETLMPLPATELLLDGSWRGDAEFLIANIISVAAARAFPAMKDPPEDRPGILIRTTVVDPQIVAAFQTRMEAFEAR